MQRIYFYITILTMMISLKSFKIPKIVGGFTKQDNKKCQPLFNQFGTEFSTFKKHQIKSCYTQIVNGVNYKIELENPVHSIKNCLITVYQSLDKKIRFMKNTHGERDCITQLEKMEQIRSEIL